MYASEKEIYEELAAQIEATVRDIIYRSWRQNAHVDPCLISWPATSVKADHGEMINGPILCELSDDRVVWPKRLKVAVERTNPFALLLVEQKREEVVAILESRYGTKSWHYPIEKHGPDTVLGPPITKTDDACIGVLWRRAAKAEA